MVRDLNEPDLPRPDALRLRAQAAVLVYTVARTHRVQPPADLSGAQILDWLLEIPDRDEEKQ